MTAPPVDRVRRHPADPQTPVTARQLEALTLAANGWTTVQIARRMGIGPTTVTTRLGIVQRKLGAASRTHAVALAMARGLIRADEVAPQKPSGGPLAATRTNPGLRVR